MAEEAPTLVDIILEDDTRKLMKAVFPGWRDRMLAYGKLIVVPTFKHPLEAFPVFDVLKEEGDDQPKPMSSDTRSVIEWGLESNRIAPQFREHFQAVLLVEAAFEETSPE